MCKKPIPPAAKDVTEVRLFYPVVKGRYGKERKSKKASGLYVNGHPYSWFEIEQFYPITRIQFYRRLENTPNWPLVKTLTKPVQKRGPWSTKPKVEPVPTPPSLPDMSKPDKVEINHLQAARMRW